jgi:uncharacterized protein YuzE
MKLHYDRETDSLYIDLNARPSVDSREIQDGVVIALDEKGQIVGIDILHSSCASDLPRVCRKLRAGNPVRFFAEIRREDED